MSAGPDGPFASHLARWRVQEPEMQFAEPFVPGPLRPRFRAWGTLLGELERSLLTPSDPQVAAQRLAWWHAELRSVQAQHPVARALLDAGAAAGLASPVAGAATLLAEADGTPADTPAALLRLGDFAEAVAAAEQALFGGGADPRPASQAVALGLLARWLPVLGQHPLLREHLPLQLLARHGGAGEASAAGALAVDLARELLPLQPQGGAMPLFRAMRWRFDRVRLARLASGRLPSPQQPVPGPLRATWLAWGVARHAAR